MLGFFGEEFAFWEPWWGRRLGVWTFTQCIYFLKVASLSAYIPQLCVPPSTVSEFKVSSVICLNRELHLLLAKEGESPDWADCKDSGVWLLFAPTFSSCLLFSPLLLLTVPGAFSCFCGISCHLFRGFLPFAFSRADEAETEISYCMVVSSLPSRVLLTFLACCCLLFIKQKNRPRF